MRKMMIICTLLAAVAVTQCGEIRFVDVWDFQGVPAYGQTRAPLLPAESVPEFIKADTVKQATFEFGRGEHTASIKTLLCTMQDGTRVLYVDSNADGTIVRAEKARLADLDRHPPEFGEADDTVWLAPVLEPFERLAAFRFAGFGRMLACALRGYGRAEIPDGETTVPVIFIDAKLNMFLRIDNDEMIIARTGSEAIQKVPVAGRFDVGETAVNMPKLQPFDTAVWEQAPQGIVPTTFAITSLKGQPLKVLATVANRKGEVFRIEKLNEPVDLPAGEYSAESLMLIVDKDQQSTTYTFTRMGTVPPVEVSGNSAEFELIGDMMLNIYVDGEPFPEGKLHIRINPRTTTSLDLNSMSEGQEVCSTGGCCGSEPLTGGVALLDPDGVKLVRNDGLRASCCGTFARSELTVPYYAKPGEYTIRAMVDTGLLGIVAIDETTIHIGQ